MKKLPLIYATTNPGKLHEVGTFLSVHDLVVQSPREFGVTPDVEETGATLEENARRRGGAWAAQLPEAVIISDDTGVEIAALNGEPGIFVRRWKDHVTEMTDEEIITHCIERMKGIPVGQRSARFHTVVAVQVPGKEMRFFEGSLDGEVVEEPIPLRVIGFPFESLLYIPEYGKMLGEIHQLSPQERQSYPSHREKAMHSAAAYIAENL